MIQWEGEVLNMIHNGKVIASHTGYVNNIFYNEQFTFKGCNVKIYSLFFWIKHIYEHNENHIYKFRRMEL